MRRIASGLDGLGSGCLAIHLSSAPELIRLKPDADQFARACRGAASALL